MPLQQRPVDAGLAVKAFGKAPGYQITEVFVPLLVPAQKDEVVGAVVHLGGFIVAGAPGHIDLAADDGLYPLLFALLIKINGAVHHPVVGDGHGGLAQGLYPGHQLPDAAGAVQKTVFGVDVKVDKLFHGGSFP